MLIFAALSEDDEEDEVWSEVVFVDSSPYLEVHIVQLPLQVYTVTNVSPKLQNVCDEHKCHHYYDTMELLTCIWTFRVTS